MLLKINKEKIELDGMNITDHVTGIEIEIFDATKVVLTLIADVEAEIEADLLRLEKKDHARFDGLNDKPRFVRVR